jgi:hypothetical protein
MRVGVVRSVGVGVLLVMVRGCGWVVYSCENAGPRLSATVVGDRLHIKGRFLGEYELGFQRVRIQDAASEAVICDMSGDVNADVDLTPGINTPSTMFGHDVQVTFQNGSGACQLLANHEYVVTLWGNNGFGNVRSSSIPIRL